MANNSTTSMNLSIDTPESEKRPVFAPGLWLWVFTAFFLPLFVVLGFWQLNRANEKEQMLVGQDVPVQLSEVDWTQPPMYRPVALTGRLLEQPRFFLDNKTFNGQFGYEFWQLLQTEHGVMAVSLGWVPGSQNRDQLPDVSAHVMLQAQPAMFRPAPQNPLFGVDANAQHPQVSGSWVVQTLSADWLRQVSGQPIVGFAQLLDADQTGVGTNIWQPTVMSPAKHRGYAVQWFGMAGALLAMFIYAGLRSHNKNNED